MTVIRFQSHTPAGRAIQHLLDTALAEHVDRGIGVSWDGGDARRLVIHPSLANQLANEYVGVDGSLIMLLESLAGTGAVNLNQLYALADDDQRQHIAMAVFIAAGYEVGVPAGKRRAS